MIDYNPSPRSSFDRDHITMDENEYKAHESEIIDRDLRPYEDSRFLLQRLGAPSRLFRRRPELSQEATGVLMDGDGERINDMARTLADARQETALANEKPINTILSSLAASRELTENFWNVYSDTANQQTDEEAAQDSLGALTELFYRKVVGNIPTDKVYDMLLTATIMQQHFNELAQQPDGQFFAVATKHIEGFRDSARLRYGSLRYIEALPGNDRGEVNSETVERDNQYVAALFGEVRATQQTGVKMGYTPDSDIGSFVFSTPTDFNRMLGRATDSPSAMLDKDNTVAEVFHSEQQNPKRIKLKTEEAITEDGKKRIQWSADAALSPVLGHVFIGKDGELYADAVGEYPLAKMAADVGKYGAYREQQAKLLGYYYDLTHALPAEEDEAAGRDVAQPSSEQGEEPSSEYTKSFGRLVIPRLQKLRSEGTSAADENDRPAIREHGVVWHIRTLPKGWKHSPAALELATKHGLQLEEGKTIVREHKRGSRLLGQVVGHKLVQRVGLENFDEADKDVR